MKKNIIFYDLETNGLDYYTTGIMQICILDLDGNTILNQYTYPFDRRIDATEIHGIDEKKLIDNNAITTYDLCIKVKTIIRNLFNREDVYLISYNNFGFDQVILENNFKLCKLKIPDNWYFIDVFPIIKELYPNIKPNYKLANIYKNLCNNEDIINYHCALADTKCLYEIFKKINTNNNCIIDKYTRTSSFNNNILDSPISSLYGYNNIFSFEKKGIFLIGDIYKIFKESNNDNTILESFLKNKIGIYSIFYIQNLVKQINFIYYIKENI